MAKSIVEVIIGDLSEKRAYRQLMKRVGALPEDYRRAFKNIQQYLYNVDLAGSWMTVFTNLLELFEESAAQNKPVLQIIGSDVSGFCDELVSSSTMDAITAREKFNREIYDHFHREGK